jgi:branched-chain amino acid transport system ATP-binding protein
VKKFVQRTGEPFMTQDPLCFETIDRIRRERRPTILLVEQRVVEALELCDRGYVLETGRVVLAGPREALVADARVQRAYLGA